GWEITALSALLGAGLAGATTMNGIKQGLCVGVGAAVVLTGMDLASGTAGVGNTLLLVVSTVGLGFAGGWVSGKVFPPVDQRRVKGAWGAEARYYGVPKSEMRISKSEANSKSQAETRFGLGVRVFWMRLQISNVVRHFTTPECPLISPIGSARPPRCRARNASTCALKCMRFSGRAKPWPSSV